MNGSRIEFTLNGRQVCAVDADIHSTLLDFIRARGLTGAKEGCAEGECGACNVAVVASRNGATRYLSINSCLMLLPMAAGQEIYTVEALAENGQLCEVQTALATGGGSQCGYCTPGFVMSLWAEQYRPGRSGPCDPHSMGGNLCRCTGYRPIRDAALSLGPAPEGKFRDRLLREAPELGALKYEAGSAQFSRPASVDECLELSAADPEARYIAGATDLAVEANLRFRRWKHLIGLDAIAELRAFDENAERVRIGAGLPLDDIGALWDTARLAVKEWLPLFASPSLRNRATLGGSLATASPIGDAAPLLIALDASLEIAGRGGRRKMPVDSFFTGYRKTVLEPGELITAIEIAKPFAAYSRFYKVAKRSMDDISTVAAAMAITLDARGEVENARFAFGGVAATPVRSLEAEDAVLGRAWNPAAVQRAQAALERTLRPISDHRGSGQYRLEVAKSLIEKFWWEQRQAAA